MRKNRKGNFSFVFIPPPHNSALHEPQHFSHSGSVFAYRLRPDEQ